MITLTLKELTEVDMVTPGMQNRFLGWLDKEIEDAVKYQKCVQPEHDYAAANYWNGYVDALEDVKAYFTGE